MSEAPKSTTDHQRITEFNNKSLQFIEDVTTNADEVQKKVLTEILSRNANVEYLKRYGLNGHVDRETFKKIIPVITYEDIKPDIDRIANGDKSTILCSQPISEFSTSSGTSGGERKLIPTIEEEFERKSLITSLMSLVISQYVADIEKGKGMYFLFIKSETKTPCGLLARPSTTSFFKSAILLAKNKSFNPSASPSQTSPYETILCLDYHQSLYSQMLCGLFQNKLVNRIGGAFASGFILVIRFLEKHWNDLCHDIRTGTLSSNITDPLVREAVMKILKPDPELADYIEQECSKESWKGIITRLWPNTKFLQVIYTGTMSQYIPILEYYCSNIPLISTMYASSECYSGINLNPFCKPSEVSYTLIPNMAYFEFLPILKDNEEKEEPKLVDLVEVELGKEYELVITTYAGLYRYRVGDILRVTGFKNKAPQFAFVCRENVVLSIDLDKTTEDELQNAIYNAVMTHLMPFDAQLIEYTSYADTSTIPGHYSLFWELSMNGLTSIPPLVFEDCCLTVEESLNSVYRQGRVSETIGPIEIKIVEDGTFDKLLDYSLSLGATITQYKTPRCIKSAPIIELMNSRVVRSYFSPKCPKFIPGNKQWSNIN